MRPYFHNVIHIEGMDLAGKTTAASSLKKQYGASVRRNSLVVENKIYTLADTMRRTTQAGANVLGHLYVASLARDLELLYPPYGPTIQDSTILLRSTAFYRVLGDSDFVDILASMVGTHPRFGVSLVLTASIDARLERLEMRRRLNPEEIAADDLAVERNPEEFLAMESALIEDATRWFGAHVIDTSDLEPSEVVAQVTHYVTKLDL